jgi:hypothetical protein
MSIGEPVRTGGKIFAYQKSRERLAKKSGGRRMEGLVVWWRDRMVTRNPSMRSSKTVQRHYFLYFSKSSRVLISCICSLYFGFFPVKLK